MAIFDDLRRSSAHERSSDDAPARGTPGRVSLTQHMPPSAHAIARAMAAVLRTGLTEGAPVQSIAARGVDGGGAALPHLDRIQASFGHHDVGGVRAHVGGAAAAAAAELGARAYATGDDVAFASAPDLRLAAHEAAHVVQQRGGVRFSRGIGAAGDDFERHADAVAELVVRGESAEALLNPFAHRGSAGGAAVQREETGAAAAPAAPALPGPLQALLASLPIDEAARTQLVQMLVQLIPGLGGAASAVTGALGAIPIPGVTS
ncbi:MAG TPA: DUF4157 domain-containing protein [Kofleriaceae bacterium]|jgi:hypothetical protein|nr:DUF4157 domain-containing protein [Kofleriaceae bacterium]